MSTAERIVRVAPPAPLRRSPSWTSGSPTWQGGGAVRGFRLRSGCGKVYGRMQRLRGLAVDLPTSVSNSYQIEPIGSAGIGNHFRAALEWFRDCTDEARIRANCH